MSNDPTNYQIHTLEGGVRALGTVLGTCLYLACDGDHDKMRIMLGYLENLQKDLDDVEPTPRKEGIIKTLEDVRKSLKIYSD